MPLVNNGTFQLVNNVSLEFTKAGTSNHVSVFQNNGTTELGNYAYLVVDQGYTQYGGTLKVDGNLQYDQYHNLVGGSYLTGGNIYIHGGTVDFGNNVHGYLYSDHTVSMDAGTIYLN